ncbi:MAG: AAA family ATPase [Coriobacteriales bacterium]|jgi:ABC-2 type transport system ATP-binding protein|nr:AAA family ATPase [Coriobacteriales bacterium]
MSRGTKSKAMLAIALVHSPSILVLDEVTSGLDPSVRREVLDLLQDKAHDEKTTILFSTHLPNDIEKIADSVCFLNKGQELFNLPIGQLQGLYRQYRSDDLDDLVFALMNKEV